ncbi:Permease [Sesbania bispinosa]|nr:Permease [Sesbania bispinosa]
MMGGESEHPQSRTHRRNNNGSWSTSSPSMGNVARLCHYGLKALQGPQKRREIQEGHFIAVLCQRDHPQNCSYFYWIDEAVEDSASIWR